MPTKSQSPGFEIEKSQKQIADTCWYLYEILHMYFSKIGLDLVLSSHVHYPKER